MWKRIRRWSDWFLLAAVILWGFSLTVNARRERIRHTLPGRVFIVAISPALLVTDLVEKRIVSIFLNQFEGDRLRDANVELRHAVARLNLEIAQQRDTNARLRRVAGGMEARALAEENRLVLAEVIGYGRRSEPDSLLISRGARDGLDTGQPVVFGDALVGKVAGNPMARSAYIQLLTDPNSWTPCALRQSRVQGVARGGGKAMEFLPKYIAAEMETGAEIVTNSLSGSLFPGGLRIGAIERVMVNEFGEKVGIVRPAIDFSAIEEVVVLTPSVDDTAASGTLPLGAQPQKDTAPSSASQSE